MASPFLVLLLSVTACAPRMRMPGPVRVAMEYRPATPEEQAAAAEDGAGEEQLAPVAAAVEDPHPSRRRHRGWSSREAEDIAAAARKMVGKSRLSVKGERFRSDCSGFVAAAYAAAGQDINGSSADLYARAKAAGVLHRRKTPEVGDLAFFDNTYDRNHNGRRDDTLSHVAVVEAIADDGTIVLVHYGSKGVARITMDLRQPDVHVDDDGILRNSYVRSGSRGKRLTGELFRDFGSLWKVAGES